MADELKVVKFDNALTAFDMSLNGNDDTKFITLITLFDFNWVNYKAEFWLPTKEQGIIYVNTLYAGAVLCDADIVQWHNNEFKKWKFSYPTTRFKNFLKRYLERQLECVEKRKTFDGSDLVVDLYNDIISFANSVSEYSGVSDLEKATCLWHYNEGKETQVTV